MKLSREGTEKGPLLLPHSPFPARCFRDLLRLAHIHHHSLHLIPGSWMPKAPGACGRRRAQGHGQCYWQCWGKKPPLMLLRGVLFPCDQWLLHFLLLPIPPLGFPLLSSLFEVRFPTLPFFFPDLPTPQSGPPPSAFLAGVSSCSFPPLLDTWIFRLFPARGPHSWAG